MNKELENIDSEIRRLKRKAHSIRENLKPQYLELNDIPLMQFRGNRLRFSTVTKPEPTITKQKTKVKMSKIKITIDTPKVAKSLVAAKFSGISVMENETVSPKKTALTLQYARGEELLEMGEYIGSLTDADVKAEIEKQKEAVKAAKEAGKK